LGMNWWEQIWISGQNSDSAVWECGGDRLHKEDNFIVELWIFQTADKPAQALSLLSTARQPWMQNTYHIYQKADNSNLNQPPR
jgi:hypothetical protein